MKKIFTAVLFFALIAAFCGADDLQDKKDKLSQIKAQIKEQKEKEQQLHLKQKKETQELEKTKKNLESVSKEVSLYKGHVVSSKNQLSEVRGNLQEKTAELNNYQNLLSQRLRFFYKKVLFPSLSRGPESLYSARRFSSNRVNFKTVAGQYAFSISKIEGDKVVIENKKSSIEKDVKAYSKVLTEKTREKSRVESNKKEKEKTIEIVSSELSKTVERERQLAKEAASLQKMISSLTAVSGVPKKTLEKEALIFERDKDKLPWPVSKGKVTSSFGWTSSQKYPTPVFNSGIEIEIDGDQNVVCVSKGRIMFSGLFRSYGKMVIIDHGGGYCSVYSGLKDALAALNSDVAGKDVIGTASGNFHFEMRKDTKPIDPLEWLKNR